MDRAIKSTVSPDVRRYRRAVMRELRGLERVVEEHAGTMTQPQIDALWKAIAAVRRVKP